MVAAMGKALAAHPACHPTYGQSAPSCADAADRQLPAFAARAGFQPANGLPAVPRALLQPGGNGDTMGRLGANK